MAIYQLGDWVPSLHETAWVADSAQVIGHVEIGADSSVWFGAVLRGDNDLIRIGRASNIQDLSVLHVDDGVPLHVGDGVIVGHQVMLHGCTIGDGALVGIQSVILNKARIGRQCVVGAGAVVTEGKEFPDRTLIIGAPAKAVRELSDEQIAAFQAGATGYVLKSRHYRQHLKKIG